MKRFVLLAVVVLVAYHLFPQQKTKSGFGFGAIPAVSYDSDLGLQYGAIVNLYDYGNGKAYPKYNHSLYLEYSRYTKGSGINRLMYDSEKLIPGIRSTIDITYLTDEMSDFYGFNGYETKFNSELSKSTRIFYKTNRDMFRAKADFQGNFGKSAFGWVAGYLFYHFNIDTVNNKKLDIEKKGETLYELYRDWGLINNDEARGGNINYIKLGLKYDTRDQRSFPSKGCWTEMVIQSAPRIINPDFPHTKLSLIHRQYFKLAKDMVFAGRFDYQMSLGNNHVPYYAQPLLITSFLTAATNQGLGGKTTVRGVLRNRVVGDAVAFTNLEWRYKFLHFNLLKQNFYLATNLFFDAGMIVKRIDMDLSKVPAADKALYFADYRSGVLHSAAGAGLKIGWNENFVISADYGKAFDKQDGNSGFYVGLNYLF